MALVNVYSINVDIKRRMTSVVPTFKQGDAATLKFRVYDDGVLLELTNDMYSEITFTLPNGETLLGYPELVNGELVYDFTGLEMVRPGKIITILSIMKNSTMVSIPPFNCFIFDSMRTETLSYIGILQDLIKETQDLGLNFEDITDSLSEILELAEGELDELRDAVQTATSEVVTWRSDEQQRVTREQQRINSESTRTSNEQSRVNAESNRVTKENARTSAENARVQAESSRVTAFNNQMQQATSKINEMDVLIDNLESFDYSPSVTYDFPNLITHNGSTYMALKQVRNITPTNDKINYRLVAQRGVDGTGSVSKVNGVSPDANGNVVIDVGDSEELNIHKNNISPQKHINVVSSIPNDVSNMGILVKVDGSSSDVPAMTTVDELNSNIDDIREEIDELNDHINNLATTNATETIIEVGANKQFTTVTSAINSITDNSRTKRYKIKVFEGTYAERIDLKSYVGVEGVNRDTVIFELDRPLTTPNSDVTNHSMVELHSNGSYIRNITVKGSNFRYMIHSEFGNGSDISIEVDNCYVEHKGNDSSYSWASRHAVGAGLGRSNTTMIFKSSTFIGAENARGILIHDNANPTSPSTVYIEGCTVAGKGGNTYEAVNLDNYAAYTGNIEWIIHLNNNVIQGGVSVTGSVSRERIIGGGNSMPRYFAGLKWVDSYAGVYGKNNTNAVIPRGTALRFSGIEDRNFEVLNGTQSWEFSLFAGFALNDIPVGGFGWAVHKGVANALFGGTVNYLEQVVINENGAVIKYDLNTSGKRIPIGRYMQVSASVGDIHRVLLIDDIRNAYLPSNVLTTGSNVVFYPWGGSPLNWPAFIGQFAFDTVQSGVYIAKGTSSLNDWVRLN